MSAANANRSRGGHRCPRGVKGCGSNRLRRFPWLWYCSRTCELLGFARTRALHAGEIDELASLLAEPSSPFEGEREAAA